LGVFFFARTTALDEIEG